MDNRPQPGDVTDRNLALELVRVTEAAALAASRWIGLGKKNEADGAAVEAMRRAFDQVAIVGHRRDRRRRDGRGADALYRREGRRRRTADGHRRRSAGRHHAHLQGRPQRPRRRGAGRARQFPARARHLHGQDRRRRRPARRRGRSRRAGRQEPARTWPRPSSARCPTWWPASSTATATRS